MTTTTDDRLTVRAPAKINLTLAVKGRRADGYHELESWVVCIDLADELQVEPAGAFQLTIENAPLIPNDERNLVHKAAHVLAKRSAIEPSVSIRLVKHIPAGAGLGGGSSDAAACLLALNRLWRLDLEPIELAAIGAEIGSDVPLFIHGGQLVMRGRGEMIEPLDQLVAGWVAIICPKLQVSTSEVYKAHSHAGHDRVETMPWTATGGVCEALMPLLFNDLESAAFVVEPALMRLHARLDGFHGRHVRLTGSGSAMFTLFDNRREAESWAVEVRKDVEDAVISVHGILTDTESVHM